MKQRIPVQSRARHAVDTLHEATARILEGEGETPLTSNHIAERAGYAVGTFYDYFPNKQALLRSMALREAARQVALIERSLAAAPSDTAAHELVRILISAALRPFGSRHVLRRKMMRLVMADPGVVDAAYQMQQRFVDLLICELIARGIVMSRLLDPFGRQVLAAAVSGAIQQTALASPARIEDAAFEDSLVDLVLRVLTVQERPLPDD
jgi:AcrR family transcriptional regulator